MRIGVLFSVLIAAVALAGSVSASPSTLVWIPSTDIQAEGQAHITFDNYFSPGSSSSDFGMYGLTVGFDRIEVGVDYFTDTDSPWFFNAKGMLIDETDSTPRVVAGIYNWSPDSDVSQDLIYILASKTFSGTRITAGYGFGDESTLGPDDDMVMLGIDRALSDKWWAAIDYQGGDSPLGALSAGVAYKFAPNTSMLVGYDFYNNSDIKDTITVQLDIDFPL